MLARNTEDFRLNNLSVMLLSENGAYEVQNEKTVQSTTHILAKKIKKKKIKRKEKKPTKF